MTDVKFCTCGYVEDADAANHFDVGDVVGIQLFVLVDVVEVCIFSEQGYRFRVHSDDYNELRERIALGVRFRCSVKSKLSSRLNLNICSL